MNFTQTSAANKGQKETELETRPLRKEVSGAGAETLS
jgi:hypothetical protein